MPEFSMTDPLPDSAARWAAAENLAHGITDEGLPRRRSRVIVRIAVLIAISWLAGVALALVFPPHERGSRASDGSGTAQLIAQAVFLVLGLVVGTIGFIWAKRSGHYVTRWRAVASPLDRQERKSLRRQITGKEDPPEERLPVLVAAAIQSRRAVLGSVPIYSALLLIAISSAIGANLLFLKVVELGVSILFVASAAQLAVLYRRMGKFVDHHRTDAP
jgi:hypothetical protein